MRSFSGLRLYRQISGALALLMTAVLLLGCGENATPTPAPATPTVSVFPYQLNPKVSALPATTLKVWFADDYYNEPPIVELIKEFKQAYPNITIAVDHAEWNKLRTRIKEAVVAGNPPDVAHQHAFVFGAQGYAEPVDDLWEQWGAGVTDRFMPGALEDVTWSRVRYGIPLDINAAFLFYNKQMFKEAGLPEPGGNYTYTQLLEYARKLTLADGSRFGLGIRKGAWDVFGLLRSNGGEIFAEQAGRLSVQLDSPANQRMLQYVSDLIYREKVSPPAVPEPVDLFLQRKVAMFFSGPWDLKKIETSDKDLYQQVGTATLPRGFDGKTNGSVQGGGSLFVPKGSKNRDAAFEFMKWAASPRYQLKLAREMARYPVLSSLYNDQFFRSRPILLPYIEQLQTARPYKLEAFSSADQIWEQTVEAVLSGGDPKSILSEAQAKIQPALNSTQPK